MWPVTPLHHLPLYCSLLLSNSHRIKPFYSFISLPFPSLSPKTHTHTHIHKSTKPLSLSLSYQNPISLFFLHLSYTFFLLSSQTHQKRINFLIPQKEKTGTFFSLNPPTLFSLSISQHTQALLFIKPKEHLPKRKTHGSHHQRLFEENVRKTNKRFANFETKGSRVVYV